MEVKTALLVIDVQQEIFEQKTPVYRAEEMLANINALVEKAHQAAAPVVYIQHSNNQGFQPGSRGWQLHQAIQPQAGDLHIDKLQGNAFAETELAPMLEKRGIERIVCCGLVTQGCVRATCLGGLELGFEVVLASDAHSTYSKTAKQIIKQRQQELTEAGVTLLLSEEISF
ncbi:MAG: isochorismatase family protein [Anaerolineales bacterium]|nr:isochorismatase family protein [Anaerolineales bacterium]